MKFITLVLLSLFTFCGCMTTKGIRDTNLIEKEYNFLYKGERENLRNELKVLLLKNGFSIKDEDLKAGIFMTEYKQLTDDERVDPGLATWMLGSRNEKQYGRFLFFFKDTVNMVKLTMTSRLIFQGQLQLSNSIHREDYSNEYEITQGYPLMMKYRALLEKISNVNLIKSQKMIEADYQREFERINK